MENVFAGKLTSTRGGTLVLGIAAAVLAAIILLVYLNRYRESIASGNEPVTVLVADRLIPKGTPGTVIARQGWMSPATIREKDARTGAFTDPSTLTGRVASTDVFPNQQLTAAEFAVGKVDGLATRLVKDERAISVPLDSAHGMIGQIQTGDRVDVYAGFTVDGGAAATGGSRPVIKLLVPNALVLSAPDGGKSSNFVLKANYQQGAELAWAVDNGKVWLMLRPAASAKTTKPSLVTAETILFGIKPVRAYTRARAIVDGGAR